MGAKPSTALEDLADWEFPSLERRMSALIDHLQKKKLRIVLDQETLGEQVYSQLWDQIRELGAAAANEAVAGLVAGPGRCVSRAMRKFFLLGRHYAGLTSDDRVFGRRSRWLAHGSYGEILSRSGSGTSRWKLCSSICRPICNLRKRRWRRQLASMVAYLAFGRVIEYWRS